MNGAGWAIFGGVVGAGVVTGIGMYLKAQELQSPALQAAAQQTATEEATRVIGDEYGLTPARMEQISAIARRFGAT